MKTFRYVMTVIGVVSWGLGGSAAWAKGVDAQAPMDCTDFRCHFGDAPKADLPLIAEPFVSFYRDQVIKPMRPYHDREPTAWQLPVSRSPRDNPSDEAAVRRSSARE
ncbi:hypothetical protein F0A16_04250 [Salinicola corii]|uniref:Uncharacterized protein n=1 Tax=Salinicola corii TaxID=2606937 RepID=A0A640WGP4_9GAMM|nr:hypothetical protein [Salinicola corii]KAA0019561.1 hypothetical protein F0A16_04250 [Salinicola corii]